MLRAEVVRIPDIVDGEQAQYRIRPGYQSGSQKLPGQYDTYEDQW